MDCSQNEEMQGFRDLLLSFSSHLSAKENERGIGWEAERKPEVWIPAEEGAC